MGRGKRYTEDRIIKVLREIEAGASIAAVARSHGITDQTIYRWRDATQGDIYAYVRSRTIYRCPSDPAKERSRLSYSMNTCLHRLRETDVAFPSRTILLMEESEQSVSGNGLNDGCFVPHFNQDLAPIRHNKGGNFALADGSATWIAPVLIRDTRLRNNPPGPRWPWFNPFRADEGDGTFDRDMQVRCEVALRGPKGTLTGRHSL